MSIRTNIFSLTKLFEDGHVMEISLEFERRAKAYNDLLAENERLKSTIEAIYRIDPLFKEAVASAMLAAKEGRNAK